MPSSILVLDAFRDFLSENVSPRIKLLKPNDNNVNSYELVNPQVHTGWLPPKGYLPVGMEYMIPGLVVGFDEAEDDREKEDVNIRISAVVYRPGTYLPQLAGSVKYQPSFEGYRDLLNLIDLTKAELMRATIINGVVSVQSPIKKGMYQQEQPYPYWYGWIMFTAKTSAGLYVPSLAQQYL